MTEAIILAGGKSTRMQENKMLLPIKKRPLILATIAAVYDHVNRVIVVTGKYHNEIVEVLKTYSKVECIRNLNFEKGMFESIKTGVAVSIDDFLILPGDLPNVKSETIKKLLHSQGEIRVPSYEGRKGHPIFFKRTLKTALLNTHLPHLKAFRDQYPYTIIEVDDQGILEDIDTKSDYYRLIRF